MATPASNSIGRGSTIKRDFGLPLLPEILELIFWEMDASTFFIALQTCKQFAEAGSTRKNLLHQIRRIPGAQHSSESSIKDLCIAELRRRCCQDAARSGCMAGILADLRGCELPSGTIVSKSAFSAHIPVASSFSHAQKSHMALANEDGTITVYSLANKNTKLTLTLNPLNPSSPHTQTKIKLLAFSRNGDLVVLHGSGVRCCEHHETADHYVKSQPGGATVESDDLCRITELFELTIFDHCTGESKSPAAHCRTPRRSQVLSLYGAEPVNIALGCKGNVCIAWTARKSGNGHTYKIDYLRKTTELRESLDPSDQCGETCKSFMLI